MYTDPGHVSAEAQRAEFDSVVQALGPSSRLARLLQYMGEKYFAGKIDDLQEYNIATEVFGRSPATFDSSQDAVARVETHRLRKRLKEFYSSEGKDHPIQLSIAAGSYVPRFVRPPEPPRRLRLWDRRCLSRGARAEPQDSLFRVPSATGSSDSWQQSCF